MDALVALGGSGTNEEIEDSLISAIGAKKEQLDTVSPNSINGAILSGASWARTYLKAAGYAANPKMGVWVLTEEGRVAAHMPAAELKQIVIDAYKKSKISKKSDPLPDELKPEHIVEQDETGWSAQLLERDDF